LYAAVNPSICLWSTEKEKFENDSSHRMGCCDASKTSYLANYNLRRKAGVAHYHHSQIVTVNMTNLSVSTKVVA
jgi:hypothetical protein